jgi:hypothetical protein
MVFVDVDVDNVGLGARPTVIGTVGCEDDALVDADDGMRCCSV